MDFKVQLPNSFTKEEKTYLVHEQFRPLLDINLTHSRMATDKPMIPDIVAIKSTNNIEFKQEHRYLVIKYNNINIGLCDNGCEFKFKFFPGEILPEALRIASSCISPETSSNAPSMILHQTISVMISMSLDAKCQFEQKAGKIKPDVLVDSDKYLDITSENIKIKFHSYPSQLKRIVIDKYAFASLLPPLAFLIDLSKKNDKIDVGYIYDRVKQQSLGKPMLYTQRLLSFFSSREEDAVSELSRSQLAQLAYEELYKHLSEVEYKEQPPVDLCEFIKEKLPDPLQQGLKSDYFFMWLPSYSEISSRLPIPEEKKEVRQKASTKFFMLGNYLNSHDEASVVSMTEIYKHTDYMLIHGYAYDALCDYGKEKLMRDQRLCDLYKEYLDLYANVDLAWHDATMSRLSQMARIDPKNGIVRNFLHHTSLGPVIPMKSDYMHTKFLWLTHSFPIDPDHEIYLNDINQGKEISTLLAKLRDYHELRFKSKIALALTVQRKPRQVIEIRHWSNRNIVAKAYISGLLFESDQGVAYVSYYVDDAVTRTEKWRLPDVEAYSVAHHRLVCLIASAYKGSGHIDKIMMTIYARLLNENSWGMSKFLKAYRYFSSGICMMSEKVPESFEKMMKTVDKAIASKYSYKMIIGYIQARALRGDLKYGLTPLFLFPFKDIGWDCFLVDITPFNTYGRRRHLEQTITELANEIDLYNQHFGSCKALYDHFEQLLDITNVPQARRHIQIHISNILRLSGETKGRFTFSPLSTLIMELTHKDLEINFRKMQGSVKNITELMTAKASHDTYTLKPALAIQSIQTVIDVYKSTSTSLIGLKIIFYKLLIDAVMRMFDKPQRGSNREISILSAEERVLQSITESFCEKLAELSDIDYLHKRGKFEDMFQRFEESKKSDHRVYLTADQTRWGPNFNTATFGLMLCSMMKHTTEAYIPALICFLSEFKIFEMPSWIPNVFCRSDSVYSLMGKVGRSHMGQGIFHQTSSLYHSFVLLTMRSMIDELLKIKFYDKLNYLNCVQVNFSAMVTSDDLLIICYLTFKAKYHEDMKEELQAFMREVLAHIRSFLCKSNIFFVFFGIKGSDYKNIISSTKCEFNSMYVSTDSIGDISIKFSYALVDPSTTGSFLHDYHNVLDTYVTAINSGCPDQVALLISKANYLRFLRQWNLRLDIVGMPKDVMIREGISRWMNFKSTKDAVFGTVVDEHSYLRYKTREIFLQAHLTGDTLSNQMLSNAINRVTNTREQTAFKSMVTHAPKETHKFILMNSPYFKKMGLSGETYSYFVKKMNEFPLHMADLICDQYQSFIPKVVEKNVSNKGHFRTIVRRKSMAENISPIDLAVSLYPQSEYASDNPQTMMLHLLRNRFKTYFEAGRQELLGDNFYQTLSNCDEALQFINLSGGKMVQRIYCSSDSETIEYNTQVYYPPRKIIKFRLSETFKSLINVNTIDPGKQYISRTNQTCLMLTIDQGKTVEIVNAYGVFVPEVTFSDYTCPFPNINEVKLQDIGDICAAEFKYRKQQGVKVYCVAWTTKKKVVKEEKKQMTLENIFFNLLEQESKGGFDFGDLITDLSSSSPFGGLVPEQTEEAEYKEMLLDIESPDESEEKECYHMEVDYDYGLLANPTYAINMAVKKWLYGKLIENNVIITDDQKASFLNNNIQKYTFDHCARRIDNYCKSITSFMISEALQTNARNVILEVERIGKRPKQDIINKLMYYTCPNVYFTTEPVGEQLNLQQFQKKLRSTFYNTELMMAN